MATGLVIAGLMFLAVGFVLRTVLMMRSSDATPSHGRVLYGRQLLRQYRSLFPKDPMPLLARASLLSGILLLAIGISYEMTH